MRSVITQYYPNSTELKKIRTLLPKKDTDSTAVQKIAKRAKKSTSSVYKVLDGDFKNIEILHACCQVIIEDSERKKAIALSFMQQIQGTESRV